MTANAKLRVLSYDVSENKRRRRIARILEEVGSRVQYSVFEMRISDKALQNVLKNATSHLADSDSLRVYTVGKTGERKCLSIGASVPIDRDAGYWLM